MAVGLSALRAACSSVSSGRVLVLVSARGWIDPGTTVRLERVGQVISSVIEPEIFRVLVPQFLAFTIIVKFHLSQFTKLWPKYPVQRPVIACQREINKSLGLDVSVSQIILISRTPTSCATRNLAPHVGDKLLGGPRLIHSRKAQENDPSCLKLRTSSTMYLPALIQFNNCSSFRFLFSFNRCNY
jgi:hypothetical protein